MERDWVKDEIIERWDYSSQRYDGYHGHGIKSRAETEAWRDLFSRLLPEKGLKILEVGCGTCEISLLLAGLGHEVHGLDISPKMLAKAEVKAGNLLKNNGGGLNLHLGDAEDPPFEDGTFDVVVSRHVLWTLPSPGAAVQNWSRMLRDGGRVLVIDALWDDGSLETRLRKKLSFLLVRLQEKDNLSKNFYSEGLKASLPHAGGLPPEKARAYVEGAGFRDIRVAPLKELVRIQKQYMPFRYRVSYTYDYYAVLGQKRANGDIS